VTQPRFQPLGDRAVLVTLGDAMSEETHAHVRAACRRLSENPPPGVTEVVPAYTSVAVHYLPERVGGASPFVYDRLVSALSDLLATVAAGERAPLRLVEIPVCYGGALGPDLEDVARQHDLSTDEVVSLHTAGEYLVYMLGFMPGFAYMGGLAAQLVTPRRSSPRTAVPAGTVGIGGNQTGVYSLVSPGGWNLIGRTPLRMFRPEHEQPTLLTAGDRVRFRRIAHDEYIAQGGTS